MLTVCAQSKVCFQLLSIIISCCTSVGAQILFLNGWKEKCKRARLIFHDFHPVRPVVWEKMKNKSEQK